MATYRGHHERCPRFAATRLLRLLRLLCQTGSLTPTVLLGADEVERLQGAVALVPLGTQDKPGRYNDDCSDEPECSRESVIKPGLRSIGDSK